MLQPILIQGQMAIETEYLFSHIHKNKEERIHNCTFVYGEIDGYPVVASNGHYAEVNAAMATTLAILKLNPLLIINQGTAGGHREDLKVGDVVLAKEVFNANSHKANFRPLGKGSDPFAWEEFPVDVWKEEKATPRISYSPDERLQAIALKALEGKAKVGTIASGDMWNEEMDRIKMLRKQHDSYCEEMELFAVAQVADNFDVPWIVLRVISNNVTNGGVYDPKVGDNAQKDALEAASAIIKALKDGSLIL